MKDNFLQFEIWHDCINNCAFCHNKENGNIDKTFAIQFVKTKLLDKSEFQMFNELGFIGGEFFDPLVIDRLTYDSFLELIDIAIDLIKSQTIKKFYVATALMFSDKTYLDIFLDKIQRHNVSNKVLLCTSYDLVGRFTLDKLAYWKENMAYIHKQCPDLQTHIEMIVTGEFIQQSLDGKFDIVRFRDEFMSRVDYISPHIIDYKHLDQNLKSKRLYNRYLPNFFPERKQFLKFVHDFMVKTHIIDINTFLSKDIRADKVYTIINGHYYIIDNRRKTDGIFNGLDKKLGITYIYGYLDSDKTMEDDIEEIKEMI